MSFAKNMGKSIGSQKFLDHAKQSIADAPKTTSRKAIQETATGNLIKKFTTE